MLTSTRWHRFFARHKITIIFALILVIALWWRTYRLTVSPPALAPDEIDYALTAKSVAWFGRDLTFTHSIWSLQPFVYNVPMGELTPIYQIFTQAWLPSSLLTVKIMPVIYSLLALVGVYVLVFLLWRRQNLALITMAVLAINPWAIFIGRTGYDGPVAWCLFTWSWVCLVKLWRARKLKPFIGWTLAWFALFFWGFFTYHGLKIGGSLTTMILLAYLFCQTKPTATSYRRAGLIATLAMGLLAINTFTVMRTQMRTSELSLFNFTGYIQQSDRQRRLNLAPKTLTTRILDNSRTLWWLNFWERYGDIYNPKVLFMTGVLVFQLSVWSVGEFHLFEAFALLISFYLLLRRHQWRELCFAGAWLLAAPITYALKTEASNWVYQNCLLLPLLAVLIAYTWETCWQRYRLLAFGAIGSLYLCSLIFLAHNYFDRYPIYAEEQWYLRERLLARYLQLTRPRSTLIITQKPWDRFRDYIFYTQAYTRDQASLLAANFAQGQKTQTWDNITWSNHCEDLLHAPADTIILEASLNESCAPMIATLSATLAPEATAELDLVALKDSGANYRLWGDTLCRLYSLSPFSQVQQAQLLQIEQLSTADFCQTYMIDYSRQN